MTAKYRVCPTCRGEGRIVNRAVSVWTSDDRDSDPEGFESMLQGDYDIACTECGGQRVVTASDQRGYAERRREHFSMLREQGIYPGSPDYF
jgi:DnaJ-class molecular chaperone